MRILIVEDMEEYREILGAFLPGAFDLVSLTIAEHGQQAIEILQENPNFDLVVCDYSMPQGTGADVFRHLQRSGLRLPFVLFTAVVNFEFADFVGPGFLGVVPKHDLAALEHVIRLTFDLPALRKPRELAQSSKGDN